MQSDKKLVKLFESLLGGPLGSVTHLKFAPASLVRKGILLQYDIKGKFQVVQYCLF